MKNKQRFPIYLYDLFEPNGGLTLIKMAVQKQFAEELLSVLDPVAASIDTVNP